MGTTLSKERRAEIEEKAWDLRLHGFRQSAIAEQLGIDQSTVSRALARVRQRVQRELHKSARGYIAEQVEQCMKLIEDCFESWRESRVKSTGNVRYVAEIRALWDQVNKLLGLYVPIKTQELNPTKLQARLVLQAPPDMTKEQWLEMFNPEAAKNGAERQSLLER